MKTNILISAKSEDAEYFKKVQRQYKDEGRQASVLFGEIIKAFKESVGETNE